MEGGGGGGVAKKGDQNGGSGMEGGTEDLKSNPYANDVPLIMIHHLHCFSLASETVYYFSLD